MDSNVATLSWFWSLPGESSFPAVDDPKGRICKLTFGGHPFLKLNHFYGSGESKQWYCYPVEYYYVHVA